MTRVLGNLISKEVVAMFEFEQKMVSKRILIIEDEPGIREMLSLRLKKERFEVLEASEGASGLQRVLEEQPDLVLLAPMSPCMDGLDILRKLRDNRLSAQIPIIIVGAKRETSGIIACFELGADDYVAKPFSMSILLARINALLRRFQPSVAS
jgi:DNA-binding response OmpR family regulator